MTKIKSLWKLMLPTMCAGLMCVGLGAQSAPDNHSQNSSTPAATNAKPAPSPVADPGTSDHGQPASSTMNTTTQNRSRKNKDKTSTTTTDEGRTSTNVNNNGQSDSNKKMPKTAGELPLIAALGGSSLALATMLRGFRRRRL